MIPIQRALVVVALAVDVHEIKLVNQPMTLPQLQSSVDGAAIQTGIQLLCPAQKLRSVQFWILANGVVRHGMAVWSKLPGPQRWPLVSYLECLAPAGKSP